MSRTAHSNGAGSAASEDNDTRIEPAVDRAVGAVIGSAVGDALGAGYEGSYPHRHEEITMRGGLDRRRQRGEWTDDTAMALGILDVLATGSTDTDAIAANFIAWSAAGPPDIGQQTRWVLNSAARPRDVPNRARAYMRHRPEAAGNGALMRTAPVALAAPGDRDEVVHLAAEIASLTHTHPDSVAACVLWSLAIEEAIRCADACETFDFGAAVFRGLEYMPPGPRRTRWADLIDTALTTPDAPEARRRFTPNGWVVTAFQAALWAISNTPVPPGRPAEHFREVLVAAVRVGHDTDTVAAIAGGLLGARWGLEAIPDRWTRLLHGDRLRGNTVSGGELAGLACRAFQAGIRRLVALRDQAADAPGGSPAERPGGQDKPDRPGLR